MERAVRLHAAGRRTEAEAAYHEVLRKEPDHPGATQALGVLAFQAGRLGEALQRIGRALEVRPDSAEGWNNLGMVLRHAGRPGDAADAHRRAVALKPDDPNGFTLLGLSLRDSAAWGDAEDACRRAVALRPDQAPLHNNLGTVLMRAGRLDEAAAVFRHALRLQGSYVKALNNLGTALLWAGRPGEALAEYDRALLLAPDYAEVHWHRAAALLTMGDWRRGWQEYEWRWACAEYRPFAWRLPRPLWDGSNLSGQTILLTPEQGLGDSIQFARYVPLLAAAGAKVLLACQPELERLLATLPGAARVVSVAPGPGGPVLPPALADLPFDRYLPLLSLPHRFGTTVATAPAPVPYLRAEAAAQEAWRVRLEREEARAGENGAANGVIAADTTASGRGHAVPVLRVGLVWAGKPIPDPARTCGLQALAPLAEVANRMGAGRDGAEGAARDVRFYSLQTGPASGEARQPPDGMVLTDFSSELRDFADTAALIANLDLVITIDTAVAHLAGAMGKPTWTLLRRVADWRWLTDREDSPWYPTMRLFRQPDSGNWAAVARRVAAELERFAVTAAAAPQPDPRGRP